MKLETAYYTSQLVVAVAVVLSLIFVGVQVQQNTKALQHETYEALGEQTTTETGFLIGPRLHEVWWKTIAHPETLEPGEVVQMSNMMFLIFHNRLAEFRQFQQGTLSEAAWRDMLTPMKVILAEGWHRHWWNVASRTRFAHSNPEFVRYINQLIDEQSVGSLGAYFEELQRYPGNPNAGATP